MAVHIDSKSPYDPLKKWNDHEACWQMKFRGSLGESLLHVLIMCNTRAHTRIATILLKCFPKLALDVVEGEEYLGKSQLMKTLIAVLSGLWENQDYYLKSKIHSYLLIRE